jgi:hypothetical protein
VPRWAWAIAGGGVAVALVAIAVVVLMGGEQKKIAQEAEAHAKLPIAPADAAPTIVSALADAAPARELEVKVVRVHVESTPQGAEIYGDDDGRDYGPTPTEVPLPVHDRDVHLRAQLAGYDDHPFTVNPLTQDNDPSPFKIKLDKAIGHAPRMKQMHPANGSAAGSGSAAPRTNPTGGELHNNPFTVPPRFPVGDRAAAVLGRSAAARHRAGRLARRQRRGRRASALGAVQPGLDLRHHQCG